MPSPIASLSVPAASRPATRGGLPAVGVVLLLLFPLLAAVPAFAQTGSGESGGGSPAPHPNPPHAAHPGDSCPGGAPTRVFDVVAIRVDIPLNRFGDHVPEGRMYALREDLPRIREAEARQMPQQGLADDPIQPLVLRAHLGDCVTFLLTNLLTNGERASLHLHGASHAAASSGATEGFNPDSTAAPGETRRYRFYLDPLATAEGALQFHSHGNVREQVHFGLFGALIAEPKGTHWLNPRTGGEQRSGWDAILVDPAGRDFREYAVLYHEWGTETYQPRDKDNDTLPLVDPFEDVYRPGSRAINYRSEPLYTRALYLAEELGVEPQAADIFSSYTHGDAAQPIARAYLGDPVKWRLMHAGGETAHVHHTHGGGIRWPFQPAVHSTNFGIGLQKDVELLPDNRSMLLDSQTLMPGESYNAENECGAGGCQQSAGDFFFHCHINEHYPAGMWGLWRVHNTLQGDLRELPDRAGGKRAAVPSTDLIGTRAPDGTLLTADTLPAWLDRHLPPRGIPRSIVDSSVMDWTVVDTPAGPLVLNEPESHVEHPNFVSPAPGERLPILFDPVTKRPAYPVLRPHPGERPPFAPGAHGPSAYLPDRLVSAVEEDTLCPSGRPMRFFDVRVTAIDIPVNRHGDEVEGIIFALANHEAALRNGTEPIEPLVVRVNTGDCVRIILANGLPELEDFGLSTVSLHPHFGQFDIQASDGATIGFNYEQAIRPYTEVGTTLAAPATAGATQVTLVNASRFHEGAYIAVGLDGPAYDVARILRIEGTTLHLATPLRYNHSAGAAASDEFVTHEIYFDFQAGTVYFHDHVAAEHIKKGQFGLYVAEPIGSTFRHPGTGATVPPVGHDHPCHHAVTACTLTGTRADILTSGNVAVGEAGGPFRETVVIFGDNAPIRHGQRGESWVNYRQEPLDRREDGSGDRRHALSSFVHGDPYTGVTHGYVGDPLVFRVNAGSANHIHSFVMPDHLFPVERFDPRSIRAESFTVGQSERFDLVARVGGLAQLPGDYLWYNGLNRHFEQGSWGLVRAHETRHPDVLPLPGRPEPGTGTGWPATAIAAAVDSKPPPPPDPGNPCPPEASVKRFNVSLIETDIVFNTREGIKRSNQKVYVLDEDIPRILRSGGHGIEPLVLHVNLGACMEIRFTNRVDGMPAASLHSTLLYKDVRKSSGITAGYNYEQSVAPNASILYRYWARDGVSGMTVSLVAEFAQMTESWDEGAFGAITLVPPTARVFDPRTGATTDHGTNVAYTVSGGESRRVFTVLFQEEDERIGMDEMPYPEEVDGIAAINYRMEPFEPREERNGGPAYVLSSFVHGDPETPVFRAFAGEAVTFLAMQVRGEQPHAFTLHGHQWALNPEVANSSLIDVRALMPVEHLSAIPVGGAGGPRQLPGDYLYGDHRLPFMEAGMWGLFRVYPEGAFVPDLVPLPRPPREEPPPPPPPGKGPGTVPARPGVLTSFQIEVQNLLRETQSHLKVRVEAPAGWTVRVTPSPIPPLAPGEKVTLTVTLLVPANAQAGDKLLFRLVLDDGTVQDMGVAPEVTLQTAEPPPGGGGPDGPGGGGAPREEPPGLGIPGPGAPALLIGALALGVALGRRRTPRG